MASSLDNSQRRLDRNALNEACQKDDVLRDLTDSLMRVVSGRPGKRNNGELKMGAEKAAELKEQFDTEQTKSARGKKGRSKSVETKPKGEKKTRKRDEEEEPAQHEIGKRVKRGEEPAPEANEDAAAGTGEDVQKPPSPSNEKKGKAAKKKASKEKAAKASSSSVSKTKGKGKGVSGKKSKKSSIMKRIK